MNKNKKGFTLVELCVVMAVTAIVVSMCVGFMMYFQVSTQEVGGSVDTIEEITRIQNTVERWIQQYDNINYYFAVSGEKKIGSETKKIGVLQAVDVKDNTAVSTLQFADGHFTGSTDIFKDVTSVEFSLSFEEKQTDSRGTVTSYDESSQPIVVDTKSIIKCSVTYQKNDRESAISLIFPIFTKTSRERYSQDRSFDMS